MNSDFRDAQVGDKCWCIQCGECTIIKIDNSSIYSIIVDDNKGGFELCFTKDGKRFESDVAHSLFKSKPKIFMTKVEKTVELEGYYYKQGKLFHVKGDLVGKAYPAKATITYEEEI